MSEDRSCLIIGAGMAGLTAARLLHAAGWSVRLLDKGRRVGGRMATRRLAESHFDHGAQFFTVRAPRFQVMVDQLVADGVVVPWFAEGGHLRYRGVEGMNSLPKHMGAAFKVRTATKVTMVEPSGDGWCARTECGKTFTADAILLTAPAPQSLAMLSGCVDEIAPEVAATLRAVEFDPCFALMVTVDGASAVPAPGYVRPAEGPLEWIADNTQKGISTGVTALTLHSRAGFAREHLDSAVEEVERLMLEAAAPWLGGEVKERHLHRWLYSKPVDAERPACLYSNYPAPLAVAGDAFGGSRIEAAFLSGVAAAEAIIAS